MTRALTFASIAATALALSLAPASAQYGQTGWNHGGWNNSYDSGWNGGYNNGWQGGSQQGWNGSGRGWNSRGVSGRFADPSYNSDVRFRANNRNRCTQDLGYGRYEYCD